MENDWFRRLQIGKEEEGDWGDLPREVGRVNRGRGHGDCAGGAAAGEAE